MQSATGKRGASFGKAKVLYQIMIGMAESDAPVDESALEKSFPCYAMVARLWRIRVSAGRCRRSHSRRIFIAERAGRRVIGWIAGAGRALLLPLWRIGVLVLLQLAPNGNQRHLCHLAVDWIQPGRDCRR